MSGGGGASVGNSTVGIIGTSIIPTGNNNSFTNCTDIMTSTSGNVGGCGSITISSDTVIHPPQPPIRTSSNPATTESSIASSGVVGCGVGGGTTSIIHSSINHNPSNTSTLKKRVQIQEVTV